MVDSQVEFADAASPIFAPGQAGPRHFAANELTNWNGATLAYDLNGNMTNDSANTYTWNARDQLASIAGNVTASFQYDPFGRRQEKMIAGISTDFLYDGVNPVQELSGGTANANLLTGLGVDEYFTRTDVLGTSDFLTDALSSTLALADSSGTVQTQYAYAPDEGTTKQGASYDEEVEFLREERKRREPALPQAGAGEDCEHLFLGWGLQDIAGGKVASLGIGGGEDEFGDLRGLGALAGGWGSGRGGGRG